jgi:hypothetical protein
MVPWHQHPVPSASMLMDNDPPEIFQTLGYPDPVFRQGEKIIGTRFHAELIHILIHDLTRIMSTGRKQHKSNCKNPQNTDLNNG